MVFSKYKFYLPNKRVLIWKYLNCTLKTKKCNYDKKNQ